MGLAQILVEHQRIVVGIEEGEQADHAGNVLDRPVLADIVPVQLGLGRLDVGDAEGQGGAALAARLLALAEADIDPRDGAWKARTRRYRSSR